MSDKQAKEAELAAALTALAAKKNQINVDGTGDVELKPESAGGTNQPPIKAEKKEDSDKEPKDAAQLMSSLKPFGQKSCYSLELDVCDICAVGGQGPEGPLRELCPEVDSSCKRGRRFEVDVCLSDRLGADACERMRPVMCKAGADGKECKLFEHICPKK